MIKNIEVELKFQILDDLQIRNFTKQLSFIEKRHIVDVYLDTESAQLYKKGVFIRIRNNKKLDFKFNPEDWENPNKFSDHTHCDEYSFPFPLRPSAKNKINKILNILQLNCISRSHIDELKKANRLVDSVTIDKKREIYQDEIFLYSYDKVKELGTFLEIEHHAKEADNLDEIKKQMRERLKDLNLKLITTGYNELYWKKNNFDIYLSGRFLLDEDYKKYRPSALNH